MSLEEPEEIGLPRQTIPIDYLGLRDRLSSLESFREHHDKDHETHVATREWVRTSDAFATREWVYKGALWVLIAVATVGATVGGTIGGAIIRAAFG